MRVAVVGSGYVGLTTGVGLAYLGNQVTCVDIDKQKILALREGQLPIYEPGLSELLQMASDNLSFTSDYQEAVPSADVVFIAVGTPALLDGGPNLDYLKSAALKIGQNLGEGFTVVVNKSTVPIGGGNWVEYLISEAFKSQNGYKPEDNYSVASNPEFLKEGSALYDTFYPDRIVVGSNDQRATDILTRLYRPIIEQDFMPPPFEPRPQGLKSVPFITMDLTSAELVKYAANAFLALKISFINEIAVLAEKVGADVQQVANGIGTDTRIGRRFLQAGIGWGGSCFGKDTAALLTIARDYGLEMPVIEAARSVNYQQRQRIIEKLLQELKILKGKKVGLLGLAFKPNTDDLRDAPSFQIAKGLLEKGAKVVAHDPVALGRAEREWYDLNIEFTKDIQLVFEDADAVVLVTEWDEYRHLAYGRLKASMRTPIIIDGRNFLQRDRLQDLGYRYLGVGR